MLKLVYSLFLGLLIVIFISVGISTFYEQPKAPEYPQTYPTNFEGASVKDDATVQEDFANKQKEWTKKNEVYSRNVAVVAAVLAIVLIGLSIWLHPKLDVITDGIMFGGVFTLIYAIIMSFQANNEKFTFGVVSVGLATAFALGYERFIKNTVVPQTKKAKKA